MPPVEKKVATAVLEQHHKEFGVECIKQVHHECSKIMKEMQNICLCLKCACEHPSQLDMEMSELHTNQKAIAGDVAEAQAAMAEGSKFQLKPEGLKAHC